MKRITIVIFQIFAILIMLIPMESIAGIYIVGGLTREIKTGNFGIGNILQGTIILKNTGENPQEAKIYQTDCELFYDGQKKYGEPGKIARSNASWITFAPKQLTISAKGTSEVNYSIKIPDDKTLSGTYWSVFMVEEVSNITTPELNPEKYKLKLGVKTNIRYAIQIVVNIGDTGTCNLNFITAKLVKESEKRNFQIDIENIGEKWARPILYTEIYNEAGSYIGRFDGEKKRIYPGMSIRYNINLSELPKGKYKSMVFADCGGDDIFGATYDLECKDEPNTPIDPAPK